MVQYQGALFTGPLPWILCHARNQLGSLTQTVLSLPEMVMLRYSCPFGEPIWNHGSYTGLTQEVRTYDPKYNDVLLTIHGIDFLSRYYNHGLCMSLHGQVGIPLTRSVTNELIRGRLLNGDDLAVLTVETFLDLKRDELPAAYAVITPYSVLERLRDPQKPLSEDLLFILRLGSPETAYNFVEYVRENHPRKETLNLDSRWMGYAHNATDPNYPQGYFVTLTSEGYTTNLMNVEASFLAVRRG